MKKITIIRPNDLHLHLRDEEMLRVVLPYTYKQYGKATVMPNIQPPVTSYKRALEYKDRIMDLVPNGMNFEPIIPLYLTDNTSKEDVLEAYNSGISKAMKLYPAGATTNSDSGVTSLSKIEPIIKTMIDNKIPLLLHGEVVDNDVDMFDREAVFIEKVLIPFREKFPELKIVMEHISTKEAVQYVSESSDTLAASITPHHILFNRSALFRGGLQPHNYCLPILKTEEDRKAVLSAAISGNPKFFLGTDSAPHLRKNKEKAGGSAGLFSGYNSLAIYAEIFEQNDALDRFEPFASFYGADFYGIERNNETITLEKIDNTIPTEIAVGTESIVPFLAGQTISWRIAE